MLKRSLINISNKAKFDLMRQRGTINKVYNIIKYIMQSTACRKDFTKN